MSEQKKQSKSSDSKVIIGDVKKSVKEQNKKQDRNINTGKDGATVVDTKNIHKHKSLTIPKFWKIWSYRKRLLIIVLPAALVIGVILIAFTTVNYFYDDSKSPLIANLTPDQIDNLSTQQVKEVTALKINPKINPQAGYIQALAFSLVGNNAKALKEISVVASTGYGDNDYNFHLNYGLIAARSGDNNLAISEIKQAIAILNADPNIDEYTKKAMTSRLNSKLSGFEDNSQ